MTDVLSTPLTKERWVISGFPCSPEAWINYLAPLSNRPTKVFSFFEYFASGSPISFFAFRNQLVEKLQIHKPEHLILHDFGVTIGLLALLKLKKTTPDYRPRLTLFNGAMTKFRLWQAPHPLLIQWISFGRMVKNATKAGAHPDVRLKPHFGAVKKLYRQVILGSLLDLFLGKSNRYSLASSQIQVIFSANDPYIPKTALSALIANLQIDKPVWLNYGHFPYAQSDLTILNQIKEFENAKAY